MGEIEGLFAKAKRKPRTGESHALNKRSVRVNGVLKGDVVKELQSPIATPGFSNMSCVCGKHSTLGWLGAHTHLEPQKKMGQERCEQLNPRRRRGDHLQMVSKLWKSLEGERRESPEGER